MNKLERFKEKHKQDDRGEEINKVEQQIHSFQLEEEFYWKQRWRADGLKEGDKNTKFFHSRASSKKRKDKIWGVENDQGKWIKDDEDVERQFCGYFANQDQLESALQGLNPKVTTTMNDELEQPFTEEERIEALALMCPTKALGPDKLHAVFFQKHRQSVKMGVINTCLHILNEKGQIFNFDKSSMFFSSNVKDDQISAIKNLFQLNVVSKHEKYLGMPSMIGRKKKSFF